VKLDKAHDYVFRIGSTNQHRVHWEEGKWHYEFLAGGVLFDEQYFENEEELEQALQVHGLNFNQFHVDAEKQAQGYSAEIQRKIKQLQAKGVVPCPKHGLISKNLDNICEACANTDYFDDHKGTEG